MLSAASAIVSANPKAFDLLVLIAVIALGLLTVWQFVERALAMAYLAGALTIFTMAFLFLN